MIDQFVTEQLNLFDEPEGGVWLPIVRGQKGYSVSNFVCSECGKPCPCYDLTKYCPNCGKRMKRKNGNWID